MKRGFLAGLFGAALCSMASAQLQPGDKVEICGDSITEQKIYSVMIEDYLVMCKPAAGVKVIQLGWSGDVSWGLLGRIENDALTFSPTVATTCFGMNDGGYAPLSDERAKHYREATHGLVQKFKQAGVHFIVVGSPGCVDSDTFRANDPKHKELAEAYNKTLGQLRDIAREVAKEENVAFADTYDVMMDAMVKAKARYGASYPFAGGDGVHPGPNGHVAMAYAFLKGLGVSGDVGTITLDMTSNQATASEGHKIISSGGGSIDLESTRYPFCFYGDPTKPEATLGIADIVGFNQDLNRFILKVSGGSVEKYKVTWANESKEFSSADLAKGINLAAEFPNNNPFSGPFRAVEKVIQAQQNYETPMVKSLVHNIPAGRELVPAASPEFATIVDKAKQRDDELMNASAAAVTPVRHTIKIEAVK